MTIDSAPPQQNTPPVAVTPQPNIPTEAAGIARAASIIALGNIISRVLGLARETIKSDLFGAGGIVDAFNVASIVPTMLYDLLVGGLVNSSLVPVFSEYKEGEKPQLWALVSTLLSLTLAIMLGFILIVELAPRQVAFLLSSGSSPEVLDLTARLLRITVPAVLFLSLSGVLSGLLYALKRFTYPAFTAAIFNAGIVFITLAFHRRLDITSMALGLLVGAIMQMILQIIGLRDAGLRLSLNLNHPGLRKVALLYLPIALGLLVDILISRPISYNLASQTGAGGISWMNYATYLRQLPQGLVATAVSFAVLPTLSAHAVNESNAGDRAPFRRTLAQGLRLVIVLIIPASVGLFILSTPTVALLYEHGEFLARDTAMTSTALQLYILGLPFAAVDLLLVFAFYARQNTWTPSLIGVGTTLAYLLIAVVLMPTIGLFSLMVADSLKQFLHMAISAYILLRLIDGLHDRQFYLTLGKVALAAACMGLAAYGSLVALQNTTFLSGGILEVAAVVVPGGIGVAVYLGLTTLLGVAEIGFLWETIRRRVTSAQ